MCFSAGVLVRLTLHVILGLSLLRMDHLRQPPSLDHRDHREAARVIRNLLEAAELANRNPHSCHLDDSQYEGGHIDLCGSESAGSQHVQPLLPTDTIERRRKSSTDQRLVPRGRYLSDA